MNKPLGVGRGAVSSKACAEGKGEVKKQKAAGVHMVLKHHPRFSSELFLLGIFLNACLVFHMYDGVNRSDQALLCIFSYSRSVSGTC